MCGLKTVPDLLAKMAYFNLQVEQTWRIPEQFVVHELQNVFLLDVYRSSHPISVEVNHPNEIDEIFDTISYGKGERHFLCYLFLFVQYL